MSLESLRQKLTKIKNEMVVEGSKILKEEFAALFAKYPLMESFSWKQYTDYFADGDPCTFGVHCDDYNLSINDVCYEEATDEVGEWTIEAFDDISNVVNQIDTEILERLYDDHVEVIAHRDGSITTEEYSDHA